MGRIIIVTVVAVFMVGLLGFTGDVSAQTAKSKEAKKAAQSAPAAPAPAPQAAQAQVTPMKTIFDYKKELKLTEAQEAELQKAWKAFVDEGNALNAKLTPVSADLKALFEKEGSIEDISKKIHEAYDLQASMQVANLKLSRQMLKVLTPEQQQKWKEIQMEVRKQQPAPQQPMSQQAPPPPAQPKK